MIKTKSYNIPVIITCSVIFFITVIISDAFSAGSTFANGLGHGIFFGTFGASFLTPALLLLGYGGIKLIEHLTHRKTPFKTSILCLPMILLTALLLLSIAFPRTPETWVRTLVVNPVPQSVNNIKNWHASGFGNITVYIQFEIDPSDFPQILTKHPYEEYFQSDGYMMHSIELMINRSPDFPITLPNRPLVYNYRYQIGTGDSAYWSIFATEDKRSVIVYYTQG